MSGNQVILTHSEIICVSLTENSRNYVGGTMKKFLFIIIVVLSLVYTAAFADDVSQPGDEKQLAGWYVSFNEEGKAVLNR